MQLETKKVTINFLTSHFLPENTACTNRVLSLVLELEKRFKVNVICLTEKGVYPEDIIRKYSENITIFYVFQPMFDGRNFQKRAIREITYLIKLIRFSNSLESDLVIATSPYMFMIPLVGIGINKKKVIDIRDLVWEYLDESSSSKLIIKRIITKVMKFGISRFDGISVTNDLELNILTSIYGVNNIDMIPNGIEKEKYEKLSTIEPKQGDKLTITYVGNIGLAQNLIIFVEAALKLPDYEFIIIGDGIDSMKIKNYASSHGAKNINFAGKVSWHELESYYQKSSILYAQLDENYISAMPSKLYEYASLGLPIIYGGVGQAIKFVNRLENSFSIEPNNLEMLINAIECSKINAGKVSVQNKKLIESDFLRENIAKKFVEIIEKLTN